MGRFPSIHPASDLRHFILHIAHAMLGYRETFFPGFSNNVGDKGRADYLVKGVTTLVVMYRGYVATPTAILVLAEPQSPTATVKSWGEIVPMPFPESISNTEEAVVRGVMVALTVMAGLRFIVKGGWDIYEELHKKVKRWRRHGP